MVARVFVLDLVLSRASAVMITTRAAAGMEINTCQNMMVVGETQKQKIAATSDSAI